MYSLKKLHELIMPWIFSNPIICPNLTGLQLDSRDVERGNLFIARPGFERDGRVYIRNAIKNGAIAVLSESYNNDFSLTNVIYNFNLIPVVYFNQLNRHISNIAGRFYGYPSLDLKLAGVTGTNGKTTITHLMVNWITLLGEKSAVMGTIGNGSLHNLSSSYCTTCSAVDIQRVLSKFVYNQVKFVAMEVSSHGLDQHRVDALYFDVAVFSNLSCDHLDYHNDINKYAMAKWRLFNELHVNNYVINVDDDIGYRWLSYLPTAIAVTMINKLPKYWKGKWISLVKANYYLYGTDIIFNSSWGHGVIHSQLLGAFNVSNLLLALGALLALGYPFDCLLNTVSQLRSVPGRMEVFRLNNRPTVIVDYAHTPDALEKVLVFFRRICHGQLWCIFGCGGNRDQNKRSMMGVLSEKYSNYVIITNDNPRTENPQLIINDIISHIKYSQKVRIIQDRECAIRFAIYKAKLKDFILIFGKGHERHQIIGCNYMQYSDQDIVTNVLSSVT